MHGLARCLPPLSAVALFALVFGPGCTRHDFRRRADKDVEGIISQKNIFENWQVKNWHVYPDPRARYADNTNPDRPPYPPDDYAARLLSPNPQKPSKKSGVGRVDGDGYVSFLQQWDTENRADEGAIKPLPPPNVPEKRNAGGEPAAPLGTATASAQDPANKSLPSGPPRVLVPAVGPVDRPAVRHAPPSYYPGALRPAQMCIRDRCTTSAANRPRRSSGSKKTHPRPLPEGRGVRAELSSVWSLALMGHGRKRRWLCSPPFREGPGVGLMRADICAADDYDTRERLLTAIRDLGGTSEGDGEGLGVGLHRFRVGFETLSVFIDAWYVDIEGPDELVRRVLAELNRAG